MAPVGASVGVSVGSAVAGGSDSAGGSEGAGSVGSADGSGETGAIVPASGERGVSVPPVPTLEHATTTMAMSAPSRMSRLE